MIQIRAVVIYSHDGRHRVVPFEPGRVNIISGDSRTGKSAILGIIDYCFGAKEIDVPEGKVRRNVAWLHCFCRRRVARPLWRGNCRSETASPTRWFMYRPTRKSTFLQPRRCARQLTGRGCARY